MAYGLGEGMHELFLYMHSSVNRMAMAARCPSREPRFERWFS